MRILKLTIAYDGTRYAGWQTQNPGRQKPEGRKQKAVGKRQQTIQETLEAVLRRILQEPVRVIGSGRTDAGVHALAQVAHIKVRSSIPRERLLRSLNQLLPLDIAVTRIEEVRPAFHARFGAITKRYQYRIFLGEVVPPFIRPYVHQVRTPLNVQRMRLEASALKGRHDFKAFARTDSVRQQRSSRRAMTAVSLTRRGEELRLEVEGNGFLHTMVRSIAGTLIDVGRGHVPAGTVRRMLTSRKRQLAGTTAPAKGLTLVSVEYRNRQDPTTCTGLPKAGREASARVG